MATTNNSTVAKGGGTLGVAVAAASPQPKSQRGHNKPKCKQCGNVARSRCPYECCKSCCAKNQNPCHIHVLKASSTIPEKTPSSVAAQLDQQSLEPPHSINAGRAASLRQLSNSFAQFNNLHLSLRSKKPLTRKDAAAINEWRFAKLKEYKERNIEVENEAFDRYMQNVDLLDEVLSVKSSDDSPSSASDSNPTPTENSEAVIPGLKLQISSNSARSDAVRMRIQQIVDKGLMKLQNSAADGESNDPMDEADEASKSGKRTEKLSALNDLLDKINKARSEEDLKLCLELKSQLFNSDEGSGMIEAEDSEMLDSEKTAEPESDEAPPPATELDYSFPKWVGSTEIDQETLNIVDKHFSSLEDVEQL